MKFGKEFLSQMVPEWQEAYMDYEFLKTLLKEIERWRQNHKAAEAPPGMTRRPTLYRAFSGLTRRNTMQSPRKSSATASSSAAAADVESQDIIVSIENNETMFMRPGDEGGEHELVFFRRLDVEFKKVVGFYKSKVGEVVEEAKMLNKQMDALIAFRIKVEKPQGWSDGAAEMTRLASDVAASTAALSASTPSLVRDQTRRHMDMIDESSNGTGGDISVNMNSEEVKSRNANANRPAPLEILNHVTMNTTNETPVSTLKGFLNVPSNAELEFNRENLRKIEVQLKRAFVEFYNKLRLLKNFSFLNTLAFSKLMKKYDKITSRQAAKAYLKMVDDSYLGSSDEVARLMERVEATFIKHFANSNRRQGMGTLRPKAKRERHRTTFSLGFLAGCTAALILALVYLIRARNILEHENKGQYMENMFPLYTLFGFVVLHMIMYAANIYFWRKYRVNYPFIFGFKEGTELRYRPVLLLAFGLAVLALASVLSNLDMEMDPKTLDYKALTELLPLGVVVLVIVILICPFNIIYRSSRFFFITCVIHCVCAPLYKVTLPDFFLADQLTSQVQAIRSLEFYICYYGWGDYKRRQNTCSSSSVYNTLFFIVAVIPYWCRLLQCLRRLVEEKDFMHIVNGMKYFSTIVAVSMRTAYTLDEGFNWKVAAWIASGIAAIFGTYWDLVMDWGLLQWKSKNFLLRDKLLVPYKSVYFLAIVLNVLLRFAWLQTVLNFRLTFLHRQSMIAIVACLEIIRRGIWNFFRLENEHLNNVGKYRAFKSVPLPFNYDEDGSKNG